MLNWIIEYILFLRKGRSDPLGKPAKERTDPMNWSVMDRKQWGWISQHIGPWGVSIGHNSWILSAMLCMPFKFWIQLLVWFHIYALEKIWNDGRSYHHYAQFTPLLWAEPALWQYCFRSASDSFSTDFS